MLKTREIRWFFREENIAIFNWLSSKTGMTFLETNSRIDFYLPHKESDDLAIKLREGRIEIKKRSDQPQLVNLLTNVCGKSENWIKWSFIISETDELSKAIIEKNKYDWIKIRKWRMGVKYNINKDGDLILHDIKKIINFGCQIEYTKLRVEKETWYTFGIEWFGNKEIFIGDNELADIVGKSEFVMENSMGYNEFLKKHFLN